MIATEVKDRCAELLTENLGQNITIEQVKPVGGGCINETAKLETNQGPFFIKRNAADRYPKMFQKEAKGLDILRDPGVIPVPEVIDHGEVGNEAFLILEYIDEGPRRGDFWQDFAHSLAKLHQTSNDYFGLDHHNYMGSLQQYNNPHDSWTEFFVEERMKPQVSLARDHGEISSSDVRQFEKLYPKLAEIFPEEKPALIHGDLWSGNFMVTSDGRACLIDPAAYYGHREAELAMTQLFGGFPSEFYEHYHEVFPLAPDVWQRLDIYKLYPLLIHVNLFGAGGYLPQAQSILRHFT